MTQDNVSKDGFRIEGNIEFAGDIRPIISSEHDLGSPTRRFKDIWLSDHHDGTEPRIQLNNQFANLDDIRQFILSERESKDEAEVPFLTTSLKVDGKTEMGIVSDVKQELRKVQALKINYSTRKSLDK